MKAIILAGGLGTRLREETEFRPKPMVHVGDRPILWHIMKNLSMQGISDFVIATGYRGELIQDYFLNYRARNNDFSVHLGQSGPPVFHNSHDESDWLVTVAFTGQLTNTGGRIHRASKYVDSDRFLVVYGDGLADVDVRALVACHDANGRLVTVTSAQPTSRFGILDITEDDQVLSFSEKPSLDGWINIGFFVMETAALGYLDEDCVLEAEPLARLARDGQLTAYRHRGFWQPMDTFREAMMLNDLWSAGKAPWRNW